MPNISQKQTKVAVRDGERAMDEAIRANRAAGRATLAPAVAVLQRPRLLCPGLRDGEASTPQRPATMADATRDPGASPTTTATMADMARDPGISPTATATMADEATMAPELTKLKNIARIYPDVRDIIEEKVMDYYDNERRNVTEDEAIKEAERIMRLEDESMGDTL